jgi:hypothetical protein
MFHTTKITLSKYLWRSWVSHWIKINVTKIYVNSRKIKSEGILNLISETWLTFKTIFFKNGLIFLNCIYFYNIYLKNLQDYDFICFSWTKFEKEKVSQRVWIFKQIQI